MLRQYLKDNANLGTVTYLDGVGEVISKQLFKGHFTLAGETNPARTDVCQGEATAEPLSEAEEA